MENQNLDQSALEECTSATYTEDILSYIVAIIIIIVIVMIIMVMMIMSFLCRSNITLCITFLSG